MKKEERFKKVIAHAKEYGFIFPSSEIYDGLAAVYDYGPNGAELKQQLKEYWWRSMTQGHENIVGLDAAIFMHPKTWKASGHVDAFNDPLIDNKDSQKRYRADVLLEDYAEKQNQKAEKEIAKARKRFGADFDEAMYRDTNPRVKRYLDEAQDTLKRMAEALEKNDLEAVKALIEEKGIACPVSGSKNWTEVRKFNLMYSTQMSSTAGAEGTLYLRPETAQGIFVNFSQVQKTLRMKVPFGIAQMGKAFRNEIVARQFIFRMREFEQLEMQYFVRPGSEMEAYRHWQEERMRWHRALGLPAEMYRWHDHENLAHYANAASDIEFDFPFGFKELEGIHSRTDFDLKAHQEHSGKRLQYFDPELEESYVPYVVETSIGLDRLFLAVLSASYAEETLADGSQRTVLHLPAPLAPTQVAILPLLKKDSLPEKARALLAELRWDYRCQYDEKDAIGKRYRRHDAVGTPLCVTIDHQTLDDDTVTLRHRDSMEQERLPISALSNRIQRSADLRQLLRAAQAGT